jgi:GNAT superfamily N-acetyltransferase
MAGQTFTIRPATVADAAIIAHHRRAMFQATGFEDQENLGTMEDKFQAWVTTRIRRSEYLGWLATDDQGTVVAGAGMWIIQWPPHPTDLSERRVYVMNVYTEPPYRLRGLARRLTRTILDWCRDHEIKTVTLHASKEGHALYESLGFRQTNEMRFQSGPDEFENNKVVVYEQR